LAQSDHIKRRLLYYIYVFVTYIDVKPDSVLLADVGDRLDGVEGAEDGGAGSATKTKFHLDKIQM
jgi:hypothetical protein